MTTKHPKLEAGYKPTKYQRKLAKDMQRLVEASHKAVLKGSLPDVAPLPQESSVDRERRLAVSELVNAIDDIVAKLTSIRRKFR